MRLNATRIWLCGWLGCLLLSSAALGQTKLTVGYGAVSADQLVLWVAKDMGIFAKNQIDAQLVFFTGGALAVTAMVSGDTPIIQASGPGVVSASLAGAEAVYVAGGIVSLDYQLMTQPEIKTPAQLKGGQIAIARFGGAADFVARFMLSKLGLNPLKDVTIVQVGTTPDRLTALETKRVQATVLVPPVTYMAQKKGFYLMADVATQGLAYQHQGAVTTRKYLREHPDVVRNFVKSYIESVHRMKTDREGGIKILAKYLRTDDREILEKTLDNSITENKLPQKQYPTLEGIKTILDQLALKDPKARAAKPQDFVDARFVEEFDKSGFIDGLYRRAKR
ncbi:MAG TPA: ABC transporter substrate-binding protein [Candidatus Binatia bacterium]|nr:ABC transporter substrate-binding protein [Candidatus Binatia bacterium]